MENTFFKNCSLCNKEILYSSKKLYDQALKRNSVCKSCRTTIGNKSPKRNGKRENNTNWKGYKEIPYNWFSRYFIRKGRKKFMDGNVTIQEVYDLWIKQDKKCALTNLQIGWYDDGDNHNCSIDRIDSSKGYYIENIQLVHKDVNIMKNRFDQNYFIEVCKLISNHAGGACEVK